ncbi:MAG: CocE/NonD family hydrolase, partial [Gemmatimonadota bacterium]
MLTARAGHVTAALTLTFFITSSLLAQARPDWSDYDETEVMIPMRDGQSLHTRILAPKAVRDSLPLLLTRTPYGIDGDLAGPRRAYAELALDGYIFVFQDIRGRFKSEGEFVMNHPIHDPADSKGVDESTDTWDTIEWLIHHIPHTNGKVGVLGVSYPGWLAAMAGINPHPALKAISPQAPMTDTWMGDDFFHQGAFRLSYGFEYAASLELSHDLSIPPPIPTYDTYDWYLSQGTLDHLSNIMGGRSPTWINFVEHPAYDAFWKSRALPTYLTALSVPTLTVGGWWDQEDFFGALKTYATLERLDTRGINFLAIGPWNHGGWSGDGQKLGNIDFASATGRYFREKIQAPWFAYWLHGKGQLDLEEATLFEGGDNRWRSFASWPPRNATARPLYFRDDGRLSFEPPASTDRGFDQYVSDPS